MKKLLLTSSFVNVSENLKTLLPRSPQEMTVAFIPTAADMYEDKWFVDAYKAKLEEMGFNIQTISLTEISGNALQIALSKVDIIFVGGGNTFYLLQEARKSGFTEIVPTLIDQGMIYVGSSAGSYLACPTIEMANWKHQNRNVVGLTDLTGMNLVPFLLSVHYKPEFNKSLKEGMAHTVLPVKILNDNQALMIRGDTVTLVGDTSEIVLQ